MLGLDFNVWKHAATAAVMPSLFTRRLRNFLGRYCCAVAKLLYGSEQNDPLQAIL